MHDEAVVSKLRSALNQFDKLKPTCERGLLKRKDIDQVSFTLKNLVEQSFEQDSTAQRIFSRSPLRQQLTYKDVFADKERFVDKHACHEIDSWMALILELIREVSPDELSSDLRADLLKELGAQRNLMISVATGGPQIQSVNREYIERQEWLNRNLPSLGLDNPNSYDSLWKWYGKWSSGDLPTYQSRRDYLFELFEPTLQKLKDDSIFKEARAFSEPTGWEKIDRNIGFAQQNLPSARTELEFQTIGLACRETLIDLAQGVYEHHKHPITDVEKVSKTDARRMLDAYLSNELGGSSNEEIRAYAKSALKLGNALTHQRTATFREAALCLEATASLVNIVAIISGRRDLT